MKRKRSNKKTTNDIDQDDLNQHGVNDIIPKDENWYTLDLKRGDNVDRNDSDELDISDKDPARDDMDEPTKSSSFYEGQVIQKNHNNPTNYSVTDNTDSSEQNTVVGEPGRNIDEDTE